MFGVGKSLEGGIFKLQWRGRDAQRLLYRLNPDGWSN
jgi:hypothetical protein